MEILKQNCLAFKQITLYMQLFRKTRFYHFFFKVLALPQFLRYDGEMYMVYQFKFKFKLFIRPVGQKSQKNMFTNHSSNRKRKHNNYYNTYIQIHTSRYQHCLEYFLIVYVIYVHPLPVPQWPKSQNIFTSIIVNITIHT